MAGRVVVSTFYCLRWKVWFHSLDVYIQLLFITFHPIRRSL